MPPCPPSAMKWVLSHWKWKIPIYRHRYLNFSIILSCWYLEINRNQYKSIQLYERRFWKSDLIEFKMISCYTYFQETHSNERGIIIWILLAGIVVGNSLSTFRHKQDSTLVAEQTAISSIFAFFVSIYSVFVERPGWHQEQTSVWTRGRLLSSPRLRQFRHEEIGAVRHKHPFRHEAIFPENTKNSPPGSLSFLLISQLVGKQPGGLLHFLFSFLCGCGA